MTTDSITDAVFAAKAFLRAAERLAAMIGSDEYPVSGTKYTGALRRASMDLTRALAEMRRP